MLAVCCLVGKSSEILSDVASRDPRENVSRYREWARREREPQERGKQGVPPGTVQSSRGVITYQCLSPGSI